MLLTAKDLEPGKVYEIELYFEGNLKSFLVLEKEVKVQNFCTVFLKILWLTGRDKGTIITWSFHPRVSYAINEVEL